MHWMPPIVCAGRAAVLRALAVCESLWRVAGDPVSAGLLMEGADLLCRGSVVLFARRWRPLTPRLGTSARCAIAAGIAIGPAGLGFISDVDEDTFSELGVVFSDVYRGLELNPSRLWQLRRSIFGVGAAQVLLSAAVLAGLLMLADFLWRGGGRRRDWHGDVFDGDGAN